MLWRDYFHATNRHINLDSKLALAVVKRDTERIVGLAIEVETAELARNTAYTAVRKHKAESHILAAAAET